MCDELNPLVQKVFEYSFETVESKKILGFYVRGSSSKEKIDMNKTLQIFILHDSDLWLWKSENIEKILEGVSNIKRFSDDEIFFQQELDSSPLKIKRITCGFSAY